ncbi:MAG: hypothetical protein BM556_01330 [Bacteriovorax sp. MedPE-SWde]|nr:MAG: hypothetical protein BM556_01330 [Bacteriovorax sp. MedPE-SWde]
MNLALFDFDGTITTEDTFTKFIFSVLDKKSLLLGRVKLFPYLIGYKVGIVKGTTIRQKIVKVGLAGRSFKDLSIQARDFSVNYIDTVIRENAKTRIKEHLKNGDKVIIVSASLDIYLKDWCSRNGLELICAELEVRDGLLTGKYLRGDCSGKAKADKVNDYCDLSQFNKIYAYGDTLEDRELLDLADKKFYRWSEVDSI